MSDCPTVIASINVPSLLTVRVCNKLFPGKRIPRQTDILTILST